MNRHYVGVAALAVALLVPSRAWADCKPRPLGNLLDGPIWNGWGVDSTNGRFQQAENARLRVNDIPRLKLKWAFGFDKATSGYAQPTVAGGRVFVGSQTGAVYSLDAATGCTFWTFRADAGVRNAMVIGPARSAPSGYAVYFGDIQANVYALDAASGKSVWKVEVDPHVQARVTAAPTLVGDRLVIAVSSLEEVPAGAGTYECCKFRGSVVSLDAGSGRQIWKSYTIPEEPRPIKKNAQGVTQWGPSGAAIWSAPTVDLKRQIIYVATGNAYSEPAAETTDSVLAFDLTTGKRVWARQLTPKDIFVVGCNASGNSGAVNCADAPGPDFDIGNSPILRSLPDGRQILVFGQKSGIAWGLDPDKQGEVLWQFRAGVGSALGGFEWGSAADDENAYFPLSDFLVRPPANPGGLFAVRMATGEQVWHTPSPDVPCSLPRCNRAQAAAISVIPGAVFSGAMNGWFRAYDSKDGKIIWEFDTGVAFQTVNGVAAKGGSIDGPGPTIVDGMVFTNSGYSQFGGAPGNVLLAFGIE